jgi:hypothetical protein
MERLWKAFLLMPLCVVAALAQKPDFTGTWKQVDGTQRLSIEKIQHQDPALKVSFDSRDIPDAKSTLDRPLAMIMGEREYRTDGIEQVENSAKGQRWRTVGWQGSALVFLTIVKDGYHVTVTREVWTLSDSGRTLTKAIRTVNMDGVTERTVTFQKQ